MPPAPEGPADVTMLVAWQGVEGVVIFQGGDGAGGREQVGGGGSLQMDTPGPIPHFFQPTTAPVSIQIYTSQIAGTSL